LRTLQSIEADDPALAQRPDLPPPDFYINGYPYWTEATLDQADRQRMAAQTQASDTADAA
jgi:hypothetical protein